MIRIVLALSLFASSTVASSTVIAQQTPISYGDVLVGSITTNGGVATYLFNGQQGEKIVLMASHLSGTSFYPCLKVYKPNSSTVIKSACGNNISNRLAVRLTTSGPHVITVKGAYAVVGKFSIDLERVFPAPSPNSRQINFGQSKSGSMSPAGEIESFNFAVRAGATIKLQAAHRSGTSFYPCVELWAPNGAYIAKGCAWSSPGSVTHTTTMAGRYTVLITDTYKRYGSYALSLSCLSATCSTQASSSTFGSGCAGSTGVPSLSTSLAGSLPIVGTVFPLTLSSIPTNPFQNVPVLIIGGSNSAWNGSTLPLPLANLGMGTCSLLVSPDIMLTGVNNNGASKWDLKLPLNASLLGSQFYCQGAVLDPAANSLGITSSNGVQGTIG